jgi:hypothetical protein
MRVGCQVGQAHHHPWRARGTHSGSIHKPEKIVPGDGAYVDQLVSVQHGLIPHMPGILTRKRIRGCTILIDHVRDCVCMHLIQDLTLNKTLLAKEAPEKVMT